ncbi:unnamed protein product [Protopolystoma xenopodis]|uniref:G-protein coupled receptors family 1 profile domain-containing protein n=1 Tax=Protopolystoma xenopodis TaxID=117903 RepID=A0A448XBA4_9PLAT|nr:unnamed protein product [Protopolystoma xenopodis]
MGLQTAETTLGNASLIDYLTSSLTDYQCETGGQEEAPYLVQVMRLILIPVWSGICAFGVLGNCFTVVVLRARHLRQSSTSLYLTALAFVDLAYLCFSLFASLGSLAFWFPSELRRQHAVFCLLQTFLSYTLAFLSVWLLVLVTVDRAFWVLMPFMAYRICTRWHARVAIICLSLGLVGLDLHLFWTMSFQVVLKPTGNQTDLMSNVGRAHCKCVVVSRFTSEVFPYIDLLLIAILPCITMTTANILIGLKLRRQAHFRGKTQAGGERLLEKMSLGSSTHAQNWLEPTGPSSNGPRGEKSAWLTKMLISTNVFFMVSVSPLLVYDILYITEDLVRWVERDEAYWGPVMFGLEKLVYTLWYTNFAIHFLLYCLSGAKFRDEVLRLLRSGWTQLTFVCCGQLSDKQNNVRTHVATVGNIETLNPEETGQEKHASQRFQLRSFYRDNFKRTKPKK